MSKNRYYNSSKTSNDENIAIILLLSQDCELLTTEGLIGQNLF